MPYEFTQDGYRDFSEKVIAAGGDQATLTTLLADMQNTYNDNIGLLTKLTKDNESIKAENERLRAANMDLFLRIGTENEKARIEGGKVPPEQEKSVSTAKYMENYFSKLEGNNNGK